MTLTSYDQRLRRVDAHMARAFVLARRRRFLAPWREINAILHRFGISIRDALLAAGRSDQVKEAVRDVRFWLAGSKESAGRLERYWQIPPELIAIHRAPPTSVPDVVPWHRPDGPIVCVSRQEWPKRTELLVKAMHLLESRRTCHLVGGGTRLGYLKSFDAELHHDPRLVAAPSEGGRKLYEGTVESVGKDNRLPEVMPYLIQSMFTEFPGQSGTTKHVKIELPSK